MRLLLFALALVLAACGSETPPPAQAAGLPRAGAPSEHDDQHAIERLVVAFADAAIRADADAFADLWTDDGSWVIGPPIDRSFASRDSIGAGFGGLIGGWEFLIQTPQYGIVEVDGDRATGRWLVREVGRLADGSGQHNDAFYVDRYRRTPDGWRFASREYQILLIDHEPVPGDYLGVQS